MKYAMQPVFVTCTTCSNRFIGVQATPSIVLRVEAPCPECRSPNKTPYGLVTPFFDELFFLTDPVAAKPIGRKILRSYASLPNSSTPDSEAAVTEILNAYLIWLENYQVESYRVEAPAGAVVHLLRPDETQHDIKNLLRVKLQDLLESADIPTAIATLDQKAGTALPLLKNVLLRLKGQGVNLAFAIKLLLDLLGK